jgi:hypothetical protein
MSQPDPKVLGLTVVALSIALEETLKVFADRHRSDSQWLDEAQDLALLRAQAHVTERAGPDGGDVARMALAVVEHIFTKMRNSVSGAVIE